MSSRRTWRFTAAVVVGLLVLAGCGSGSDELEGTVVKNGLGCSPTEMDRGTTAPKVTKIATAPKEPAKKDVTKGKGCAAEASSFLTLDLVGATALDGKVFTDTWKAGRPITTQLGTGQLLPALDEALDGIKVGGTRQITLPAEAAYGKEGNKAQGIAPDQALTFVVELVAVSDSPLYCAAATDIPAGKAEGKPTKVDMPIKAPTTEVKTKDLKVGTGDEAKKGNYATVHYLGVACSTGQQFDSSWDSGEPFPVTLGEGTIPGFYEGIYGMKVGGLRQIEIPFADAYGTAGQPPIGPNEPLVFVIELVALAKTPPTTTTVAAETPTTVAGETPTTVAGEPTTTVAGDSTTTSVAGDETTTTTEP